MRMLQNFRSCIPHVDPPPVYLKIAQSERTISISSAIVKDSDVTDSLAPPLMDPAISLSSPS